MKYKQQQRPERGGQCEREGVGERTVCGSRPPEKIAEHRGKVCSGADIFMCDSDTRNENLSTENVQQTRWDTWGECMQRVRIVNFLFFYFFEQMLFVKSINKFRSHTLRLRLWQHAQRQRKARRRVRISSAPPRKWISFGAWHARTATHGIYIVHVQPSNHWATSMH